MQACYAGAPTVAEGRRLASLFLAGQARNIGIPARDELFTEQETALAVVGRKAGMDKIPTVKQAKLWLGKHTGGRLLAARLGRHSGRRNPGAHPPDRLLVQDLDAMEVQPLEIKACLEMQ